MEAVFRAFRNACGMDSPRVVVRGKRDMSREIVLRSRDIPARKQHRRSQRETGRSKSWG